MRKFLATLAAFAFLWVAPSLAQVSTMPSSVAVLSGTPGGLNFVWPTPTGLTTVGTSLEQLSLGLDPNGQPTTFVSIFGNGHGFGGGLPAIVNNKVRALMRYCGGVTSSTSLAVYYRASSTRVNTVATGDLVPNPAYADEQAAGVGNSADQSWNVCSQGDLSPFDAANGNIIAGYMEANDGYAASGYYSNTSAAKSMDVISLYLDAAHTANKVVFLGDGTPRGYATFWLEACAVTSSACTAVHGADGHFIDGGDASTPIPLVDQASNLWTKVASAPGAFQYTVDATGHYTFGTGPPTTAYITYSADSTAI